MERLYQSKFMSTQTPATHLINIPKNKFDPNWCFIQIYPAKEYRNGFTQCLDASVPSPANCHITLSIMNDLGPRVTKGS